jgi:voltage-gated potassium channel
MTGTAILSLRRRLDALFDDDAPPSPASRIFNSLLAALILVNVASVVFESVEPIRDRYAPTFNWIERVATTIFAIEYVLRVWASVELRSGKYREPVRGRLRYMRSFFALVDLAAVLPAILGFLGAGDLRVLRLIRLLRMLKLTRHSTVFSLLWAVVREEARSIAAVLFILALTLIMSSALMYMVEGEAQPNVFNSIPAAMWWAIETLTTVGYGDMVPITTVGKVLGGIVSIVGIGTLALFSGLITVSFMDQLRNRREQYHRVIEAHLTDGRLDQQEIQEIERIGDQLGLPKHETVELVEEALSEVQSTQRCPHCGQALDGASALGGGAP